VYNDVGAENNGLAVYEMMRPDEVGTYNYLCATQNRQAGEKHLKCLSENLAWRFSEC